MIIAFRKILHRSNYLCWRYKFLFPFFIISVSSYSQSIVSTITLPSNSRPEQITVDHIANKIYCVDNTSNGRVFEIDGLSKIIIRTFLVDSFPSRCIVNPISHKLYIGAGGTGNGGQGYFYLHVINLANDSIKSFKLGYFSWDFIANFVTDYYADKVYFQADQHFYAFNGNTNQLHQVSSVVLHPGTMDQIAIDTSSHKIFVPDGGSNLLVVDAINDSLLTSITYAASPGWANDACVNQKRGIVFVSSWWNQLMRVYNTISNTQVGQDIFDLPNAADNWQTLIHESSNIAFRSYEISYVSLLVDLERFKAGMFYLRDYEDGRVIAVNEKTARAFYVYDDSTYVLDFITGKAIGVGPGRGIENPMTRLVGAGYFNPVTEELYVPDRVNKIITVIKDTAISPAPEISSWTINNDTLTINGYNFGILQGSSNIKIDGNDLGTAASWSPIELTFVKITQNINCNKLTLRVIDRSDFINLCPIPQPPVLLSPTNCATQQQTNPILAWRQSSGALTYVVQVSTDSSFQYDEDFESGDFSNNAWIDSGVDFWQIDKEDKYQGKYSAKATGILPGNSANLELSILCSADTITFYCKFVPIDLMFEEFDFSIDGRIQAGYTDIRNWRKLEFPVTAGPHVFKWTVAKSSSGSGGSGSAWIDSITFPLSSTGISNSGIRDTFDTLNNLLPNQKYYWHVRAINLRGLSPWSEIWSFTTGQNGSVRPTLLSIKSFSISISSSRVKYTLPIGSEVSIKLYNIQGKLIRTLYNSYQQQGYYLFPLDISILSKGFYLLEFKDGKHNIKKPIINL